MACDPNTLLEQAKCIIACIPPGMLPAVNTSLLCQILDGGGGGGTGPAGPAGATGATGAAGGSGMIGTGSPEGVVTASPGQVYFDQSINSIWVKETGVGNTGWEQYVA